MEMADEVLHNIRFINSEYYDDDNPELLPVLERIYQWYLVARPPGSHLSRFEDYERMIDLAQQMEQVSETAYGASHPETALAYRRLGDAEFQMVRHLTGMGFTLSPERYVIMMTDNVTPLGLGAQPVVDHYDDARKAYKRYLDALAANASTTPLEYAEALADLGDWYMVFEKIRKSSKLYEQAYQVLAQSPDFAELAEQWMSQPKPMHFATENLSGYQDQDGAEMQQQASRLNISMTVTHYGKVLNIEVLQPPENLSKDALVLIKNQLRGTPFRPAMRQGEVVTTRDFIWQYELMPPWGTS
jgi:tetratricopeptide (TPR) repeat protein